MSHSAVLTPTPVPRPSGQEARCTPAPWERSVPRRTYDVDGTLDLAGYDQTIGSLSGSER